MIAFHVDQEYDIVINSKTAHRSTQGFGERRVRVLGRSARRVQWTWRVEECAAAAVFLGTCTRLWFNER